MVFKNLKAPLVILPVVSCCILAITLDYDRINSTVFIALIALALKVMLKFIFYQL